MMTFAMVRRRSPAATRRAWLNSLNCGFGITYGEGLHGPETGALRERRDGAGIHASAQEYAQWHVAHQMHFDGLFQAPASFGDPVALSRSRTEPRLRDVPVALDS